MKSKRTLLQYGGVTLIVLTLIIYGYFQIERFTAGPQLALTDISEPSAERRVVFSGTAEHIAHITMNGRPIFTDTEGVFTESLFLFSGYNIITIEATDRFGRNRILQKQLFI